MKRMEWAGCVSVAALALALAVGCGRKQETPTGLEQNGRDALFAQLRDEHAAVTDVVDRMGDPADAATRQSQVQELWQALLPHMAGEESVVYPALAQLQDADDQQQALTARDEHAAMRLAVQQLQQAASDEPVWRDRLKVVRDLLDTHIAREEGPIFDALGDSLDDATLVSMRAQYNTAKQRATISLSPGATGATPVTPPPAATTPPGTAPPAQGTPRPAGGPVGETY